MTQTPPHNLSEATSSFWKKGLFRLASLAAVILGGWSLWQGMQSAPKPIEKVAFDEWVDGESTEPEALGRRADVETPAVFITQVSGTDVDDSSPVVSALPTEDDGDRNSQVTLTGYATEDAEATTLRKPPSKQSSSGAWLTGTIESDPSETDEKPPIPALLPAWKRGSKPSPLPTDLRPTHLGVE